jgi:DNA-binding response OmpR family regulator
MKPLSVVVAHPDPACAAEIAANLNLHFRSVTLARTLPELRAAVLANRADAAIVDLSLCGIRAVMRLHEEFRGVSIVCTHKRMSERLWNAALRAGAVDCCHISDSRAIVLSSICQKPMSHLSAAAA